MAKVFLVNDEMVVSTVREVSEILGTKVTKKAIVDGEVPEVQYIDQVDAQKYLADSEANEEDIDDITEKANALLDEDIPNEDDTTGDNDNTEGNDSTDGDSNDDNNDNDGSDSDDDTDDTGVNQDNDDDSSDKGTDSNEDEDNKHKVPKSLAEKLKAITKEPSSKAKETTKYAEDEEVDFPEKGSIKDVADLKAFYPRLTDKHLDDWIELEGLSYTPSESAGINRMRKCMAITNYHFPKSSGGSTKKSKSKYAQYTTEQLVEMCMENDVEVRDANGDMRILRMYCIMSLRNAKIIE